MKVHELIYKLNYFPQESEVIVQEPYDEGELFDIIGIEEDTNGDVIIIYE